MTVSTCGACGWSTVENSSRTKVWCWLHAMQKFTGSISCPDAIRERETLDAWREEREREAQYDRV